MNEILKKIVSMERAVEQLKNEQKDYKPFYNGYESGLRAARMIVLDEIQKKL